VEWIFWIVVALMLGLFCYSVFWTSFEVSKRLQPRLDSVFDSIYSFLRPRGKSTARHSNGQTGKPEAQ